MERGQPPQSKKKKGHPRDGSSSHPYNPFAGGGRLNFPSLDRALAPPPLSSHQFEEETRGDVDNVSSSPTESLDLSIDARAALHEHLRHVAKYGMDGELITAKPPPRTVGGAGSNATTSTLPPRQHRHRPDLSLNLNTSGEVEVSFNDTASSYDTTPLLNTLDEQWENILQGNNQSIQDFPDTSFHSSSALPTFNRLQVLNPSAGENEDIEVAVLEMTCIEASDEDDYFNSSKVWQLMTPEKNRARPPQAVVTQRNQDYSDSSDDDNTPDSACMVGSNADAHQFPLGMGNLRCSISPSKTPPSHSYASSPISLDSLPPDLPPIAAAAANAAAEWERSPQQKRVASVPLTDFSNDKIGAMRSGNNNNTLLATRDVIGDETGGLHNSLLATSIHEDLPIITTPFDAVVPDPEGSFADWSVQTPEHSFTMPSSVTPIRPLPPLSPIQNNLRGSPASGRPGATSNGGSNSSSSNNVPSRSSARSSTSSSLSSLGHGWRAPVTSPHRSEPDFGMRQDTASPIQHSTSPEGVPPGISSHGNPINPLEDAPQETVLVGPGGGQSSPSPSTGTHLDTMANGNKDLKKESTPPEPLSFLSTTSNRTKKVVPPIRSPCHEAPISSTAAQAGETAAKFLKAVPNPRQRTLSKSEWPAGELVLVPTESFESSSLGMVENKLSVRRITSSPGGAQDNSTSPLVSLDSIDSDRSELSRGSPDGLRSTLSVDGALARRRAYRSVVPRRILFPQDFSEEIERGDSFERPAYHLPSHSY